MIRNAKNFRSNESGAIVLIFALVLIPLVITILALNIDLSRMQLGKSDGQSATDAAALGTLDWIIRGKTARIGQPGYEGDKWQSWKPTDTDIKAYAQKIFKQNLSLNDRVLSTAGQKFEVTYNNSNFSLLITNCIKVQSVEISKSLGLGDTQKVCNSSVAAYNFPQLRNIEVAFSLDFTGSMFSTNSMKKLHEAMHLILDKYFKDPSRGNYASTVPFGKIVTFYPYNTDIVKGATLTMEGALTPKDEDDDIIDESISVTDNDLINFNGNNFIKYDPYQSIIDAGNSKKEKTYQASKQRSYPVLNVQPLTNNHSLLSSLVDRLYNDNKSFNHSHDDYGGTFGLSGIYSAWLTLAPGYQGKWDKASNFETAYNFPSISRKKLPSKDPKIKKYLIHITDGHDSDKFFSFDIFYGAVLDN